MPASSTEVTRAFAQYPMPFAHAVGGSRVQTTTFSLDDSHCQKYPQCRNVQAEHIQANEGRIRNFFLFLLPFLFPSRTRRSGACQMRGQAMTRRRAAAVCHTRGKIQRRGRRSLRESVVYSHSYLVRYVLLYCAVIALCQGIACFFLCLPGVLFPFLHVRAPRGGRMYCTSNVTTARVHEHKADIEGAFFQASRREGGKRKKSQKIERLVARLRMWERGLWPVCSTAYLGCSADRVGLCITTTYSHSFASGPVRRRVTASTCSTEYIHAIKAPTYRQNDGSEKKGPCISVARESE